jgi:hypothetical protein
VISGTHIIWWQLSFLESSYHGIENHIRQYTSLVDQSTVYSTVNHLLKLARIGFKSNLPQSRQCILLDHLATPVHAKGPQALLLVILYGFSNSLLLLILEIGFRHGDDVFLIKLGSRHVDLDLESVPLGVPKDVLVQKLICKHKGLIPDSNVKACQPI